MRRLAVLVVAAGLLVWAAAPALSVQPFVPRAVDFEQPLDLARGGDAAVARAAGGGWRSRVIDAPKRFDLIGLKWRSPDAHDVTARIRVRDADGDWSRWTLMGEGHGARPGTDPVWAGGAEAYQLRLSRRPRGLRAHFVNATGTATAADRARTALRRVAHAGFVALAGGAARAQEARGAPAIVPRAAWGAEQCRPRGTPSYGRVDAGLVHHTVSANEYGPGDSAAIVLSICRYHRNSNGWNDIGYNFVVDRYGRIFEGRAGGIDQAVVGAQAQGYNGVTTGVANIGTFSNVPQTAEGVRATADLLAWKLPLHGAPVEGTAILGTKTFQRLSGHRDANSTACPGDVFYAQLPEIRRRAAERAPEVSGAATNGLTLDVADRTLDYPQAAQARGRLGGADGAPVGGARVSVQIAGAKGFRTYRSATTRDDGTWAAEIPTAYSRTLRATATVPGGNRAVSPRVSVQVRPALRARAAPRVVFGRALRVSGTIRPRRTRVMLEIARRGRDARQHTVARIGVKVRNGRFAATVRLRRPALHRLRVAFRSDQRNRAARSADVYVRAVRGRSATGGARAR